MKMQIKRNIGKKHMPKCAFLAKKKFLNLIEKILKNWLEPK